MTWHALVGRDLSRPRLVESIETSGRRAALAQSGDRSPHSKNQTLLSTLDFGLWTLDNCLACQTSAKSLSLERKIKMQEAREGIINRLALTLPTTINLDRFLNVIVSELGRMMNVDRCDVIQLTSPSELRISHEWRASEDVPSSLGTAIPLDLSQLSEHVDITRPIRIDDTSAPSSIRKFAFSRRVCTPARC